MNAILNTAAIVVVLAALLFAFLRHRGVALPWWLDCLGAAAAPIIAAITGLMARRWLQGRSCEPPASDTTDGDSDQFSPPAPPTNVVENIIVESNKQLKQEPADDIHEQLHDEISKYLD